jgi:type IV pilus assembly protein PilF
MRRIVILILVSLLTACASSGGSQEEGSDRKAAETNTSLGQAYMGRDQNEIALEKLKRAIAQDKTYAPAHTLLAVLYERLGETDLAEKEYQEAVKYDPSDGDVNNNYGTFLCRIGKSGQAEPYFIKAVQDPFYETPQVAYANAGNCSLDRGDLDKAEAFLRQSLEYDSNYAAALLPMAELSFQQGNYLRARAFLQRYEAVGTLSGESLLLGYRIESELGDSDSADRYRTELFERFPGSSEAGQASGRD